METLGPIIGHTLNQRDLLLDFPAAQVKLTALTPTMLRVRLAPGGQFAPRRPWAVHRADDEFEPTTPVLLDNDDTLTFDAGVISAHVSRRDGRIRFADADGRDFGADEFGLMWHEDGRVACTKRVAPKERLYGFGERTGPLCKNGRTMHNWTTDPAELHSSSTDPMYIAIPVFMGLLPGMAYAVYLNNTHRSHIAVGEDGDPHRLKMTADGGALDYTVVYGASPPDVMHGLAQLLGKMPMPPLWALGYHQSRWGYSSSDEIRAIAAGFRNRDIPCDVIHFDIDHMDGYRNFTWHPNNFRNAPRLIADMRAVGLHAVCIVDAGVKVDPNYDVFRDGIAGGFFVRSPDGKPFEGYVWPDEAVWPDFLQPEVRRWWGYKQRTLVQDGVSGIWNDMNEPTSFDRPFSAGFPQPESIPEDAVHGRRDAPITHAEAHNLYGSLMAQATYEGLRRDLGGKRPFVLTRSAFAGIQRYSACWMGDNHSNWEHLQTALPQLCNMGLSGVPFVGVDIGGFGGNATPELFARWMQFGVLMPFARGHSAAGTIYQEPWAFGPEVEAICRDYLKLRYRLLPYLYSLFWQAHQTGEPVLRPLLYHYPDDEKTHQLDNQVLLGRDLLAAPVLHPGHDHRHVYLPAGDWYGYWDDTHYTGPADILVDAPLATLPLFVRGGAVLPQHSRDIAHTGDYALSPLILDVYPGEGQFTMYEDDGETLVYEDGQYATTTVKTQLSGNVLHIDVAPRLGSYTPPQRSLVLRVHAVHAENAGGTLDEDTSILTMTQPDDGTAMTFAVRLRN